MRRVRAIKIRELLLAGASATALLALAEPAYATCRMDTAPGSAVIVGVPTTNCVIVTGSFTGDVAQVGTLQAPGGVTFGQAGTPAVVTQVDFPVYDDSGDMIAVGPGLTIFGNSTLSGSGATAVVVILASTFTGGVTNSGTVTGSGEEGIRLFEVGTFAGGIVNNATGTIASPGSAAIILVHGDTFQGGISNAGTLSGSFGIAVDGTSSFTGGITNSGGVTASATGIKVVFVPSFTGGIQNASTGTINAADDAIEVTEGGTFSGGIANAGTLIGTEDIEVSDESQPFAGGISNSGAAIAAQTAINVHDFGSFAGGINNSGTVSSVGGDGILVKNVDTFSGDEAGNDITNGTGALIQVKGSSVAAISIQKDGFFEGAISNAGTLSVTGGDVAGIAVGGVSDLDGEVRNSGTISVTGTLAGAGIAINAGEDDFETSNSGGITVSGTHGAVGIALGQFNPGGGNNEVTFGFAEGGIFNEGFISAQAVSGAAAGIAVDNVSVFNGGIFNANQGEGQAQTILASGQTAAIGIAVGLVTSFTGGISNAGTISTSAASYSVGIEVLTVSTFSGGITNTGNITATGGVGIQVGGLQGLANLLGAFNSAAAVSASTISPTVSTFTGNITNGGTIVANTGIAVVNSTIYGEISNNGTVTAGAAGILLADSTVTNGINNGYLITATGIGVELSGSLLDDEILNNGVIVAGTGIAVFGSTVFGAGNSPGIFDDGTIIGSNHGIRIDSTGLVQGTNATAIEIAFTSTFGGGITNAGTVTAVGFDDGFFNGITVKQVSTFSGGIANSGSIMAGYLGIGVGGGISGDGYVSEFDGGITNAMGGVIVAHTGIAVGTDGQLGEAEGGVKMGVFTGGITNAGQITVGDTYDNETFRGTPIGIEVRSTTLFEGGVTNAGLIDITSSGGNGFGIAVGFVGGRASGGAPADVFHSALVSTFSGGIDNALGGTITGPALTRGIDVGETVNFVPTVATFQGGITNAGAISAELYGLFLDGVGTFQGGITNSGSVNAFDDTGVYISTISSFSGGLTNSGTISARDEGINIFGLSTFAGGISNSGAITAADYGINVGDPAQRFEGARTNSANHFLVGSFSGGVTNSSSGLIVARTGINVGGPLDVSFFGDDSASTIVVNSVSHFSGGVVNAGKITGSSVGVRVDGISTFDGGISNSGTISAGQIGIAVGAGSEFVPYQFRGDLSLARAQGLLPSSDQVVSVSTFNGGITNSGTISALVGIGIGRALLQEEEKSTGVVITNPLFPAVGVFTGGITNAGGGLIVAAQTGIAIGGQLFGPSRFAGSIETPLAGRLTTTDQLAGVSSFSGGIDNAGAISAGVFGVEVDDVSTFTGGIANTGLISAGGVGIGIGAGSALVSTNETNFAVALLEASTHLVVSVATFTGGVTNAGTISAQIGIGIGHSVTFPSTIDAALTTSIGSLSADPAIGSFSGGVTNAAGGLIVAGQTGIAIGGATVVTERTPSVVVSSTVALSGVSVFSGGVTNAGTISAGAVGINLIQVSTFGGGISNSGTISAATDILVSGNVGFAAGGAVINNSGNLVGSTAAIDLRSAIAPFTINQTGGTVSGEIFLSHNGDTLNITGGAVNGTIEGQPTIYGAAAGTVNFNLGSSGNFTTGGVIDVDNVNINSGTLTLNNPITVFGTVTNNASLRFGAPGAYSITQVSQMAEAGFETAQVMPPAFVQSASGNLIVAVAPTSISVLTVTGSAQIAGTVTFIYAPSSHYVAGSQTFLTATGGLGGTMFGTVAGTAPPGFVQSVTYTPATNANLVLAAAPTPPPPPPTPTPPPPPPPPPPSVVLPTDAQIYSAESFAFAQAAQNAVNVVLGRTLPEGGGNTFYNLGGNGGSQTRGWMEGTGWEIDPAGFRATSGGLEGGIDHDLTPGLRVGVAAGYQVSSLTDAQTGSATQDQTFVSLYASQTIGGIGISGAVAYAASSDHTNRFAGLGYSSASNSLSDVTGAVEVSAPFNAGGATVTPAAGVYISDVMSNGFREINGRSAAFALSGSASQATGVSPFLSIGLSHDFKTSSGVTITPDLMGGYQYDTIASGLPIALTAIDGSLFTGNQIGLARDSGLFRASVTAHKAQWTGFVSYDGEVGSNWWDQTISAGFRYAF